MYNDARPTILLVDDNPQIRSFLRPALEDSGYKCIEAVDGLEAVYQAENSHPNLIVLDVELGDPDMDGFDVCKRVRSLGINVPVIFLTVRSTVEDFEQGLTLAQPSADYVEKLAVLRRMQVGEGTLEFARKAPDVRKLIALIRARLPRNFQELGPCLRITRKQIKVERLVDEQWEEVPLAPMEYEVFQTLVDGGGDVVGSWKLFNRISQGGLKQDGESDDSTANNKNSEYVCISNIRRKIDPQHIHSYIQTVPRIGYRFRISECH